MKVLVADDHAIFRQGLRVVLGDLDQAVEILEAADFGEALAIARDARDLSLLLADLRMPQMDGFEGLRALRRLLPRTPIMVLSASEEAADLFGALESGASGYLAEISAGAGDPIALQRVRNARALSELYRLPRFADAWAAASYHFKDTHCRLGAWRLPWR